jgi:hypothetical protein
MRSLRTQLSQLAWRSANARVVLCDHWTHYALVPWNADLQGIEERRAHARIVLEETYGDRVEEWTFVLSDERPSRTALAAAIPSSLLADLLNVLSEAGLTVVSVQPHLVAAYNAWRVRLPQHGAWFVTVDEGLLAAARVTLEGWDQVHTVRTGMDWSTELRRLRALGRLAMSGTDAQRVFVDAPAWLRTIAERGADGLEWLDYGRTPQSTIASLLAMKGEAA